MDAAQSLVAALAQLHAALLHTVLPRQQRGRAAAEPGRGSPRISLVMLDPLESLKAVVAAHAEPMRGSKRRKAIAGYLLSNTVSNRQDAARHDAGHLPAARRPDGGSHR